MARYEQWNDDPDEEFEDRRWNGQRWPHATAEDSARDDQPRVNPYAMVALAAALVLLFPIAIVFALLSYGHPRGRGIAMLALLLGIAEVAAVAVAGMVLFGGLELEMPALASKAATTPVAVTTTEAVPSVGAPTSVGSTPVLSQPAASVVQKGTPCQAEQVGLLGVAADGATLLCLRSDKGHTWSGPHRVAGSYYTEGEPCDPSVDKTGRTTDNHALVCEGKANTGTWVPWTE
ncbi:hypothetical protein [Nocardia rosealba]|uniref:hypothetical protein n=1 Tax=Nocardia rosealba TaxID=2878563 RepID=UPI001CDA3D9B|nr:hypothetical protein [Nocardia rosealba]MCA2207347.1 hypothetical protein [Nocardia rosealba]